MPEDATKEPTSSGDGIKISHDLRQPLAALKTWLELLTVSLKEDASEKQGRYLEKMQGEIARMTALLDDLSSSGF